VDAAAHYKQLVGLGRDEFLAAVQHAVFVRFRSEEDRDASEGATTLTLEDQTVDETLPHGKLEMGDVELEVYPLIKKPGASFQDRITLGRTPNNDIVVADHSVSRLHAYVRWADSTWVVADGGSKNGSWLRGEQLEPRRERPLPSRAVLRLGDVDLTFYHPADLFVALGGRP
jgi:FHA domain-containing protein